MERLTDLHGEFLPFEAFNPMWQMSRFPRYNNQRSEDPYIRMFFDDKGFVTGNEYLLPKPNPRASYKSLAKYAKVTPYMTSEEIDRMNYAWYVTMQTWQSYCSDSEVVDLNTAYEALDKSTSPGIPFSKVYRTKADIPFEEWHSFFEKDWKEMAEKDDWGCFWSNCIKEEIRIYEKIVKDSQRTFVCSSLDGTIAGTRLFLDMNEKFYDSHLVTPSAVGMSPYYGGWNTMYNKLNIHPYAFELDESQWDSSLRSYMLAACAYMRFGYLKKSERTEANKRRIQNYYRNVINSLIVTDHGVVVRKQGGNPSGGVNTISDNTFILHTMLVYSWLTINSEDNLEKSVAEFKNNVSMVLCGDDNTWTVSSKYVNIFNAKSVGKTLSQIGITCTSPNPEPQKLGAVNFLSAGFTELQGYKVPLYDWRKLYHSLRFSLKLKQTPSYALERINGIAMVGFCNQAFYELCKEAREYLIGKYDKILFQDAEWIKQRNAWKSHSEIVELYVGMEPQSISGELERLESLRKMKTKQQFLNDPKRRNLSSREKERRWQQYLMSQRSLKGERSYGLTRATKIRVSKKNNLRLKMSPCAKHYMVALVSPFSHKQEACIPDLHAVPSKKIRVKTRGTFSTGANGYGWVVINPWSNSNDDPTVSYTIAIYAGADTIANPLGVLPPGVVNATQGKLPYTTADFSSGSIRTRTVGIGLRVRYIGPELARSGQILGLRVPDNQTMSLMTYGTFRSYETTKTFNNKRQWVYVMYRPVEPEDYEYSSNVAANQAGTTQYSMGVFVTSTTDTSGNPGPAPFEWEIVRYVEYIGNINDITKTHVDLEGIAHIRNALPTKSTTDNIHHHVHKVVKNLSKSISENAPSFLKNTILPAAGGAIAYKSFANPAIESASETSVPVIEEIGEGMLEAAEFLPLLL